MLEACIRLMPDSVDGVKKQGDVISVGLPGSPWGSMETDGEHFHVVDDWVDDDLEAELKAKKDSGKREYTWPKKGAPYAESDKGKLVRQSTEVVDQIAAQPTKTEVRVGVPVRIFSSGAYRRRTRTAVVIGL